MVRLITELPQYNAFRSWGIPQKLPFSLTLNVTNHCHCRCKTCNIYRHSCNELSLEELKKIFTRFGAAVYWLTLSGGEPFLRDDLEQICTLAYNSLRPRFITIPTNGMLFERIPEIMRKVLSSCKQAHFVVNLSVDGTLQQHNYIRGQADSYQRVMETYRRLRLLPAENMTIGLHTVLSRYNVESFQEFLAEVTGLQPDSFIVEYAQEKAELHNGHGDFQADAKAYECCIDSLLNLRNRIGRGRVPRYIQIFRKRYYELTKRIIAERRSVLPCYAGFSSAQIAADAEVWACGVKALSMGNLRENEYHFKKIWYSKRADEIRARIKKRECYCVSANMQYQNMLLHSPSLCKFFIDYCLS